jgi:hypothetical protein
MPTGSNRRRTCRTPRRHLLLAAAAAEGLYGRSRVQLEAAFVCDAKERSAEVAGGTEVGQAIARVFTVLLAGTVGEEAFRVERTSSGSLAHERHARARPAKMSDQAGLPERCSRSSDLPAIMLSDRQQIEIIDDAWTAAAFARTTPRRCS